MALASVFLSFALLGDALPAQPAIVTPPESSTDVVLLASSGAPDGSEVQFLSESEVVPDVDTNMIAQTIVPPAGLHVLGLTPGKPFIQLPIEVIEPYGVVETRFQLWTVGDRLQARIFGLEHGYEASVQINDGAWVNLNNNTVTVSEPGLSFGGIGGGFSTHTLTLKSSNFTLGENVIRWRFNDATHGFRVLDFDVLSGSERLLPPDLFHQDDPSHWCPPLPDADNIAAGKALWFTKAIKGHNIHCTDCHTRDGRDLKYFNFSSPAIIVQAKLLGLSDLEARQLASYIRSIPVKVPAIARPWNPPYQPGPGLDARPIQEWAAGAGIDAVLPRDEDTLNYLFPFESTGTLNAREVPVAVQYPDWRHWLGIANPIESFGTNFTNHPFFKQYANIRGAMKTNNVTSAKLLRTMEADWYNYAFDFFGRSGHPAVPIPPHPWPEDFQRKVLGAHHWMLVKLWEIMTEFELEGFGKEVFGSQANARSWLGQRVFNMAPHLLQVEHKTAPINDSGAVNWDYFTMVWYQVQITLNNSNRRNYGSGPIDFGYLNNLCMTPATPKAGLAGILMINLITAAQQFDNGVGPENRMSGWGPWQKANAHLLTVEPHFAYVWRQVPDLQRKTIIEAYLHEWLDKCESYPASSYYKSGIAKSNEVPGTDVIGGKWLDRYWAMTASCKTRKIDPTLQNRLVKLGKSLWPANNWDQFKP